MSRDFKPPFIQADFQITGRCNARCIFCKCWEIPYYKQTDLPGKIWIDTAKRLKDFTAVEYICIGGGEPFLYKDIFAVVEGINKLDIRTVVVTNGSLLSYDNCKKILDAGIKHIDVSLDNFSGKHNMMRRFPGLFEKCIEAISVLKKINPKLSLGISTLISEGNIHDIPEFLEWVLKELPVDVINFQAYNRVVTYEGADWWEDDFLWPKNKEAIIHTMDYLSKRTKEGARIGNHPLQLEKFKNYFINPQSNLNIKCPAGTFNLSVSYNGDIIGCIAEGMVGNITTDDPIKIYREVFPAVRGKAAFCNENCHFLINCYFPLHWKRWSQLLEGMVGENEKVGYKPGKVILPPEVKEIAPSQLKDFPAIIRYAEHQNLDVIGKYDGLGNRKLPHPHPRDIPCVYLCGDTSEVHRWGVYLDENDFFKQLDILRQLSTQKAIYHTIVGVRRTNFHRLHKIHSLIKTIRAQQGIKISPFVIKPLKGIKERFYRYLKEINAGSKDEGIEFRIVDNQLDKLLTVIEGNAERANFNEGNFLRALGPVCKDVFVGPRYLLLDLAGRCNLDCVYCRMFSPWIKKQFEQEHPEWFRFLDFEVIKNVLFEAKELGIETVLLVGRGEPTFHPDFLRIINLIKGLGMNFNLSTNGALLDLYNDYLVDGECGTVTASLSFASKKTFKLIRPTSDSKMISRIENNVKQLSRLKRKKRTPLPCIVALYAICKYNYKEIVKMAIHAKRLGANVIWYQLVHLEDFSRDKLYMTKEDMEDVRKLLREAKALCKTIRLGFHSFIEFEMAHYDEKKGDWSKEGLLHQGCFVGWHFVFINLTKEVFMCCGGKVVGMVDRQGKGLMDLWFSDIYRRYRNDGLIMHRENPLTLYGKPLYDAYCDSCDNHDQNMAMMNMLRECGLKTFVER